MDVKRAISKRKAELMEQIIIKCEGEGEPKKLFSFKHSLFWNKQITVLT